VRFKNNAPGAVGGQRYASFPPSPGLRGAQQKAVQHLAAMPGFNVKAFDIAHLTAHGICGGPCERPTQESQCNVYGIRSRKQHWDRWFPRQRTPQFPADGLTPYPAIERSAGAARKKHRRGLPAGCSISRSHFLFSDCYFQFFLSLQRKRARRNRRALGKS
jgi:hypothetical protein